MPNAALPGWPAPVRPPHVPGWEPSATGWLLDLCPPELRGYPVLRRHLVALARFGVLHVEAGQEATRRGLGEARTELGDRVDHDVLEAVLRVWEREDARLLGVRREVGLVEAAVRGRRYSARL